MTAPSLAQLGIGRLFDIVPDPVIIGDIAAGGVIIAWNAAAEATFGYSRSEALGMSLEMLVPDELRDAHRNGLRAFAAGGGGGLVGAADLVEVPAICADGKRIWVELRLATVDPLVSERQYVLAVLRDVTSRHEAQDDRDVALQDVTHANVALHDFVAMVSHDLRSPLAGVSGTLDLLHRKWDDLKPELRRELLDRGRKQMAVSLSLLDDLAQLSAIESGGLAPRPQDLDVVTELTSAVDTCSVPATVEVESGLRVHADPEHLRRAVVNLLENAQKYGRPPFAVTAARRSDAVEIAVADSGDGVPDDVLPHLFEKFSRAHVTASAQPGTGLGLAIVTGLLAAAGGSVRYEPGVPSGSRFVLSWPAPTEGQRSAT